VRAAVHQIAHLNEVFGGRVPAPKHFPEGVKTPVHIADDEEIHGQRNVEKGYLGPKEQPDMSCPCLA